MITEEILEWIATLPKWMRKLGYSIIDNKKISEEFLNETFKCFKIETKIEEGEDASEISIPYSPKDNDYPNVLWQSVNNLHGVNKLTSNSSLKVSSGLTVIYGENGSGKSGYTRLLNNAFVSRGDKEILPNIYAEQYEPVSAEFAFVVNGKTKTYRYPEDKEEYPFKTIRNFDSKSAFDDMNKESSVDFAPIELSFFDLLLDYCSEIQRKLDEERNAKKKENPFIKYFSSGGKAYEEMLKLSSNSKIDEIRKLFYISEDDIRIYEKTKREKTNLLALNIDKQIELINKIIDKLKETEGKIDLIKETVSNENIKIYNQQIQLLKKAKEIQKIKGIDIFKEDDIEKINSTEWKDFIVAAKKYYDGIQNHSKCPLCGHELIENDLIFRYWEYLESDAENNYNFAIEAIKLSKKSIEELNLEFLPESSIYEQWLLENFRIDTENILNYFKNVQSNIKQIMSCFDNEKIITINIGDEIPKIDLLINKICEKEKNLNQSQINNRIDECSIIEREYNDKVTINDLLPSIDEYIKYLVWDTKVENNKIKTRIITNKQKELFEKYVTEDYIETFKNECSKLNANLDVEIVSRGSNGQTLKKLQIKGKTPGKVLSEGEQRAISIANFLTEVQMDNRNVGIVLDDPVSSLDHKRRHCIVNRLMEEAKKRQIIVFTHEITFFMELKSEAEKADVCFEEETIRNINNIPGDISSIIPWQGLNVKGRIGKLKNDLQEIVAINNSGDSDGYYYKAKNWCELLRESWERAVEEILFNDAIQRYNPCIQTQRLKKAPFSQELYLELEQGMEECSSWCHDQARAINSSVPTIDDLKKYIDRFENYTKEHRV